VIALLDTSVVLRKLFGEPGSLAEWPRIQKAFASRVLDRAAGPMPTALGSLDAIHLATALELAGKQRDIRLSA
jgi:hypothetical protein